MAKAFSVASWNIEHFGAIDKRRRAPKKPIKPIIDFIEQQNADIIALYEVRSSVVFRPLVKAMPNYQFHITEGPQMQEILVGVKNKLGCFVTQKLEFKAGQSTLRPGVLVTPFVSGEFYPLLFLHLKSMPDPKGFGLRDDMLWRALDFRKSLDKAASGPNGANYLFCGDLNTMGFNYFGRSHDIDAKDEIKELKRRAGLRKMEVLSKNGPTFWKGPGTSYPPGNLDHVVAADHLQFKKFGSTHIDVRGWPKESTDSKKGRWIKKHSDHGLLYFEVQKV